MEWSTLLNRVALLSIYIGPEAKVSTIVRDQLITVSKEATITKAVTDALKGVREMKNLYDAYLLWTTLDVAEVAAKVGVKPLVEALFDLNLGDRVKRLQLNSFSDVREARDLVEQFILKWMGDGGRRSGSPWWDGIDPSKTSQPRWISTALEQDPGFYEVFRRWQEESDDLQRWLDGHERSPAMANNVASGMDVVYSANMALKTIELAEVMCFHM